MKISEIIKKSVLETNKQLKKKDRITYGKKFQILGIKNAKNNIFGSIHTLLIKSEFKKLNCKSYNKQNHVFDFQLPSIHYNQQTIAIEALQ